MQFDDIDVKSLNLDSVSDFTKLITVFFCGRKVPCNLSEQESKMIENSLASIKKNGLTFEQLNEVLLLMNQSRVGEAFYNYFFKKAHITLEELRAGIIEFRGYAILCFGDFRFAFKNLIDQDKEVIIEKTKPFCKQSPEIENRFKKRPEKILDIMRIAKDCTPYVGELTGDKLNAEADFLEQEFLEAKQQKDEQRFLKLTKIKKHLDERERLIKATQLQAIENTEVYLTWDCIDVYVATSMRNKWEFQETYDFILQIFNNEQVFPLQLRYFDPTQSKCNNSPDKGLIEGLMLKRSLCAIYMAQDSDTMGKDSELAAMLSQGKPVIAYVPSYDRLEYAQQIFEYPLYYFKLRLGLLDIQGTFKEANCESQLKKIDENFQDLIDEFLEALDQFKTKSPYTLPEVEQDFKTGYANFVKICQIISIAECYNYDSRANLLMGLHPLCMQVNMTSGVTGGVLVVRTSHDCANLLYNLLTNQLNLIIKRKPGCTILEEQISKCAYRLVTHNEKLSNSFWNFFGKT
jgi:hypothetical protein